jgi:hypothetical protein
MARRQPVYPALPGWGPVTTPTRPERPGQSTIWPRVARELLIFAVLAAVALKTGALAHLGGWLGLLAVQATLHLLWNHRAAGGWHEVGRALSFGLAVAALVAIVNGASSAAPKVASPPLKAPTKVDAAQTDYLEQARRLWADAYAKTLGQGAADPDPNAKPEGDRR